MTVQLVGHLGQLYSNQVSDSLSKVGLIQIHPTSYDKMGEATNRCVNNFATTFINLVYEQLFKNTACKSDYSTEK